MRRGNLTRWLAILLALLLTGAAQAETLTLPDQLLEIGDEAFMGNLELSEVVIPDRVQSIGKSAFANCANLGEITIPGGVLELGEGFLDGCAEDVLIKTDPAGIAMSYARAHNIDYQADTTYRALLIGQSYRGTQNELEGPPNDADAMRKCLQPYEGTNFHIDVLGDLTASGIKSAIRSSFAGAGPQDVSLFFYSGHGVYSYGDRSYMGALVGVDDRYVTVSALRSALDEIPGRKIVIIDACYSGNMIASRLADGSGEVLPEATAEDFVNSFINGFSVRSRANLAADSYFVITAAAANEESYEANIGLNGKYRGVFTSYFAKGCGYDFETETYKRPYADANGNGVITLQEVYEYAYQETREMAWYLGEDQNAQVYPRNCNWFGLLRE